MKHQINSFKCAFRGLRYALVSESHMRFHVVAGIYVIIFANFFNLDAAQWGVILLLIASMIMAEAFNTSLEELCNLDIDSYHPLARIAKDVAAGAVLILAIVALVIGFIFFWQPPVFLEIWQFFCKNIVLGILLIISLAISAVFIKLGPNGINDRIIKFRARKNNK